MQIALLHSHYDAEHLDRVKAEMAAMGAPTIKAVWIEAYGFWAALEGCHRIRAAAELGLVPEIDEVEYSETTTVAEIGLGEQFRGDEWTVADIVADAHQATIIKF